jgi:hypothetical protein
MGFLVDLWIILFYLENTEYHLMVADLNYIQVNLLDIFPYYYLHKIVLYYIIPLYCFIIILLIILSK